MDRFRIICKKLFSVSLVFNALLTITYCIGILSGIYTYYNGWQPFSPYLFSGIFFWVSIAAAVINIYPSAMLGRKLHTGRFLFHHYFYGFIVLACTIGYIVLVIPQYFFNLFLINDASVSVNIGRFFLLGGITLVLDDLPDVSERIESHLNLLKAKAYQGGKIIAYVHLICGAVSLYIFTAVTVAIIYVPEWRTLANLILLGSMLITAITSFIFVKRGIWDHKSVY
jgi:hypothetical protein